MLLAAVITAVATLIAAGITVIWDRDGADKGGAQSSSSAPAPSLSAAGDRTASTSPEPSPEETGSPVAPDLGRGADGSTISVAPRQGSPRDRVLVSGKGFVPGVEVTISLTYDRRSSPLSHTLGRVTPREDGSFTQRVVLPENTDTDRIPGSTYFRVGTRTSDSNTEPEIAFDYHG
ncbi:hypothetical protein [Streptomyces sp. NPDC058542]|uniref:hypothetical protein n=1 Tax=Streptomyces sp. NPDC058542 TaxID=3346543 RepID=UPI0036634F1F